MPKQLMDVNSTDVRYYCCVFNKSYEVVSQHLNTSDPTLAKVYLFVKGKSKNQLLTEC